MQDIISDGGTMELLKATIAVTTHRRDRAASKATIQGNGPSTLTFGMMGWGKWAWATTKVAVECVKWVVLVAALPVLEGFTVGMEIVLPRLAYQNALNPVPLRKVQLKNLVLTL